MALATDAESGSEPEGQCSQAELVDYKATVERRELGAMVEPTGQRAKVESRPCRLEAEVRENTSSSSNINTTGYVSSRWSNGLLERHNQTFTEILMKVTMDNNCNWRRQKENKLKHMKILQ